MSRPSWGPENYDKILDEFSGNRSGALPGFANKGKESFID